MFGWWGCSLMRYTCGQRVPSVCLNSFHADKSKLKGNVACFMQKDSASIQQLFSVPLGECSNSSVLHHRCTKSCLANSSIAEIVTARRGGFLTKPAHHCTQYYTSANMPSVIPGYDLIFRALVQLAVMGRVQGACGNPRGPVWPRRASASNSAAGSL